jgi:hypothetical protein
MPFQIVRNMKMNNVYAVFPGSAIFRLTEIQKETLQITVCHRRKVHTCTCIRVSPRISRENELEVFGFYIVEEPMYCNTRK